MDYRRNELLQITAKALGRVNNLILIAINESRGIDAKLMVNRATGAMTHPRGNSGGENVF